jgi:hypothetical protein
MNNPSTDINVKRPKVQDDPCPADTFDNNSNEMQCDLPKGHDGQHWDRAEGWVWGKR